MNAGTASPNATVRPLRRSDLERVIAIDEAHSGLRRRRFMEQRLIASEQRPDDYVLVGIERGNTLLGFALGRLLYGEYGRIEPVAVLDGIGVDPASQEHGYGHALMAGLVGALRGKGVRKLHSQADWTSHRLLRFFDSLGFTLAPRVVVERDTARALDETSDEL